MLTLNFWKYIILGHAGIVGFRFCWILKVKVLTFLAPQPQTGEQEQERASDGGGGPAWVRFPREMLLGIVRINR